MQSPSLFVVTDEAKESPVGPGNDTGATVEACVTLVRVARLHQCHGLGDLRLLAPSASAAVSCGSWPDRSPGR